MSIEIVDSSRIPNDFVVFFCWQDHLDKKLYRYLIRDALNRAIANAQHDLPSAADHCVLRQDSDTMNRAGSVEIANTICQKIKTSTIVVADVTPVLTRSADGLYYPNPNVMVEVGYAGATIGWNRVICLFNDQVCKAEQLPFDIRHRRVTSFSCAGDAERKKALNELEATLFVAIRTVVQEIGRGVIDPELGDGNKRRLRDVRLLSDTLSTFRTDDLDYYIDRALDRVFYYDILFYWHGFEAIVCSSDYRFYDQRLEELIRNLLGQWGTAISLGGHLYSPNGRGGYTMKSVQYWNEEEEQKLDAMMAALIETKKLLKSLLDHTHDLYPEINLLDTNRAAYESVKQYLEADTS